MGMGGSLGGLTNLFLANSGVNMRPYVSPTLSGGFTAPPTNPYAPQGTGYGTQQSSNPAYPSMPASNDMSGMEGRYEIKKMAGGGIAAAAQNMADKGRNGDSMLVHMTPGEVKGLQALAMAHGGSLSINPDTGLVEASFLKKILPTLAGVGLAMIPGVGPLAAAGMVGGFETLRTGDLSRGLMAGLGAYGGAGLGSALTSAGTSAGLGAAATEATAAGTAAGEAALQGPGYEAMKNAGLTDEFIKQSATDYASNVAGTSAAPFSQTTQNMLASPTTTGIKQLGSLDGMKSVYNAMPTGTVPALGVTAANLATPEAPKPPGAPEEDERYKTSPYRYNLASNFSGFTPARPSPYYRPAGLGYAAGGDIMLAAGGSYDDEGGGDVPGYAAGGLRIGEGIARDTDADTASLNAFEAAKKRIAKINKAANMPKNYAAKMPEVRGLGELAAAQGGSIGGYSDGGRMLKGPGDGMSDSIPATISGRQPARLADGEFVVPADVVSHLGNGSTDAGARKLYGMMDKIRKARTGKKKQAPAVKADKYMPA